jgi:hypothetical protein
MEEKDIQELNESFSSLETDVIDIRSDLKELESQVVDMNACVDDIEDAIQSIPELFVNVKSCNDSIVGLKAFTEVSIENVNKVLSVLSENTNSNTGDVQNIQEQIDNCLNTFIGYNDELENVKTSFRDISAQVSGLDIDAKFSTTETKLVELIKQLEEKLRKTEVKYRNISASAGASRFSELLDVSITNPTNGQVPVYNISTRKWENGTLETGGVQSVVAGTNISVDNTDPQNPIINALGGDTPSLQEVTDVGATTTNTTTFSPSGNHKAIIANGSGSGIGIDITHSGSGTKLNIGAGGSGDAIRFDTDKFKVNDDGDISSSLFTASRALATNANKEIVTSATTATELGYLSGVTSPIQTQLNSKGTGTVDGTMTSGRVVLAQDSNTVETDDDLSFNGSALGIGTTTPRNSRLDMVAPTIATAVAGTGTIVPSQIFDDGIVTGTGTLFLSEVKVGDLLMNNAGNLAGMVTRVVNNTQLWYVGLGVGFFSGAYKIVKRVASVEDSNGNTSWAEASPTTYNEQTGAMDYNGRIFGGGYTMFANRFVPNSGIIIKQQSNDGQMRIKHIQSGAFLNFQGSGANITANGVTIAGNSTWATPLYLGMDSYGGGQTGLYLDRTGTGSGQTFFLQTRIYASNGDAPKLQVGVNGLDIGRRDGSAWNEGIDSITLSMNKTTGKWSIGTFGTSTPTGATTRLDFATVGETFGLKTGTNATIGSATLSGGTITINTTAITANSMIVLSPARTSTANLGIHYESARTAGTSFTITSTNASDNSTFDWHLVEKL